MKIDFTGRHVSLDDKLKDFAASKLEKISRYLDEPVEVHVVFETEKHRQIADLSVSHRLGLLQAKEEANEMLDALQSAIDKIEKQARRGRKKYTDKKRRTGRTADDGRHWPLEVLEKASFREGERPRVIKTTRLPIKPMTIDEAALQLEQSKNGFFVFLDSATDRVSVLYRRMDENYGLIAPE